MNTIVDLWQFAEAASHEQDAKNLSPLIYSMKFVSTKTEETYSFIVEYSDSIYISFMGTKKSVKSWLMNFWAYPLKTDEQIEFYRNCLVHTETGEPGIIHNGYYKVWLQSKKMVDDYDFCDKQIYVTGKSQGGALAMICARHLTKNRKLKVNLVTFASPAAGNEKFCEEMNEFVPFNYRVVYGYDIVPLMPPEEAGFRHCGAYLHLRAPLWHKYFHRIRDHYYSSYTKGLIEKFVGDVFVLKNILSRVVD